jgi:hypothetical protein
MILAKQSSTTTTSSGGSGSPERMSSIEHKTSENMPIEDLPVVPGSPSSPSKCILDKSCDKKVYECHSKKLNMSFEVHVQDETCPSHQRCYIMTIHDVGYDRKKSILSD